MNIKEILFIASFDAQGVQWYRYLKKYLLSETDFKSIRFWEITVGDFDIIIKPKNEQYYRGRRPNYHYVYGLEANSYLLAVGSKRLRKIEDVIGVVKGE